MVDYYDPEISTRGAGPRRDLTAVEAAVVLERPLSMIATMILFSLGLKNLVTVVSDTRPILLEKLSDVGAYPYETDYLKAIDSQGALNEKKLRQCLINLVFSVKEKMRGFDHEMTKKYYDIICVEAWEQVMAADTPEEFAMGLESQNEWMMLDRRYRRRLDSSVDDWYDVHDTYDPDLRDDRTFPVGTGRPMDLRDMASDYTQRIRNSSRRMVYSMRDLSTSVTDVTNPPPKPTKSEWSLDTGSSSDRGSSSSSSSWGSSSDWDSSDWDFGDSFDSCDCACACACACAGGGR
jgi:hypothetical protein